MDFRFQKVIDNGYNFDMSKYLGDAWELYKKKVGEFIGFVLVYFVIAIGLSFIPFINLLSSFITYALTAGIMIYARYLMNDRAEFGQFFNGFNYIGQIALYLLTLLLFAIPLIVLVFTVIFPFEVLPDMISGDFDVEMLGEAMAMGIEEKLGLIILVYVLILAGAFYLYASYSLVLPLIADAELSFWEAMETSRRIVGKKFFSFIGMFIVVGIISMLGVLLTCGLGLFVVIPWMNLVIFSAYDSILQPQKDDLAVDVASFGTEEKDINTEAEDKM